MVPAPRHQAARHPARLVHRGSRLRRVSHRRVNHHQVKAARRPLAGDHQEGQEVPAPPQVGRRHKADRAGHLPADPHRADQVERLEPEAMDRLRAGAHQAALSQPRQAYA